VATNWRDFEKLVADIEQTLVGKGAVVKSPDRIRDGVTGQLREIDASIRLDVGSTPILITVECRKRRPVQDVTWIEQLATKRDHIGAAKTIAVSATGFSDSATKAAARCGIELRTLEDRIGEEIVQRFLSGFKISFLVSDYTTRSIAFELDDGTQLVASEFGDDLAAAAANDGVAAVVATEVARGLGLTVQQILARVDDRDVPEDGVPVPRQVQLEFRPHTFTVSTKDGPRFLKRLQLVAEFSRRVIPAPATSLYEYGTPDKATHRVIEAVAPLSEEGGIRLRADIDSPELDRPAPPEAATGKPTKKKGK